MRERRVPLGLPLRFIPPAPFNFLLCPQAYPRSILCALLRGLCLRLFALDESNRPLDFPPAEEPICGFASDHRQRFGGAEEALTEGERRRGAEEGEKGASSGVRRTLGEEDYWNVR